MTRVLIVEDDPTTSAALAGIVRRQQWEAQTREDLASAWEALRTASVDILVLAVDMDDFGDVLGP